MDEVGAGNGSESDLARHMVMEPAEDQVFDPGGVSLDQNHPWIKIIPSPANLFVWGKVETPACPLCSKTGTHEHIQSSCYLAQGDGRYRWRHDQVLKTIAEAISKGIGKNRKSNITTRMIAFVKEGEQPKRKNNCVGLLFTARDWSLTVDLDRQLKIPAHITQTMLRPDIVLVSESTKQFMLLELTVPWEERMEEAQEGEKEGEV